MHYVVPLHRKLLCLYRSAFVCINEEKCLLCFAFVSNVKLSNPTHQAMDLAMVAFRAFLVPVCQERCREASSLNDLHLQCP